MHLVLILAEPGRIGSPRDPDQQNASQHGGHRQADNCRHESQAEIGGHFPNDVAHGFGGKFVFRQAGNPQTNSQQSECQRQSGDAVRRLDAGLEPDPVIARPVGFGIQTRQTKQNNENQRTPAMRRR